MINKKEVLECMIDSRDIRETGAFICLFSNQLDTGSEESFAGIKGVDYKLEDGTLSRYVNKEEDPWQVIANLKRRRFGKGQIYSIPKSLFLKPDGEIQWRVLFFPVDQKPAFVPENEIGVIQLKDVLNIEPFHEGSIPFEYFYPRQETEGLTGGMFSFKSPTLPEVEQPRQEHVTPSSLTRKLFNLPVENCLVWPEIEELNEEALVRESNLGRRIPEGTKAVLFAPIHGESRFKGQVLSARERACRHQGLATYFFAHGAEDIPEYATGVVYIQKKNLRESIADLQKIREKYVGPMWVNIEDWYWNENETRKNFFLRAWMVFECAPLLSPGLLVENLSHKETVLLVWHHLHVQTMRASQMEFDEISPVPTDTNTMRTRRRKKYAVDAYLEKLYADLQALFVKSLESGS